MAAPLNDDTKRIDVIPRGQHPHLVTRSRLVPAPTPRLVVMAPISAALPVIETVEPAPIPEPIAAAPSEPHALVLVPPPPPRRGVRRVAVAAALWFFDLLARPAAALHRRYDAR